uniref:Intermediate filament protein n=1 Tax=Lumbricus terrestris TaxID=6398 RepID=Q25421_LUMTE|nr:intermediate filament protein [Lumbricus terrestris]
MASKTSTEKTITVTEEVSRYRPTIQGRNIIIQRRSQDSGPSSSSYSKRESISRYGMHPAMSPNAYVTMSNTGVTAVKESREQEKKDMQDLNERLANYIEKVRFLEAQNRKLADELLKLKAKWGKETSQIKAMYQAELDEARRLLDDAVKEKSRMEIRLASNEEMMDELRQRLEDALKDAADAKEKFGHQNQQLSDLEGEVGLLRRRLASLESERDKEKGLIKKLQDALNATSMDLDNETLLHIDAENRRQTLEEELEFLKALHEQELKELQALAYRDSTAENREYWKTEMGQALREIQEAYDDKMDVMRGELETYYNLKLQEFRTGATRNNMESVHFKEESKRLRDQMQAMRDKLNDAENKLCAVSRELDQLRREKEERERELEHRNGELSDQVIKLQAEMEAMLRELQMIIDAKLGLELEIITYRRLLEGEESRTGLRQITDNLLNSESNEYTIRQTESTSGDNSMRVSQIMKGEMSVKTTYQKSAKGPVAIYECSQDGKTVALENTGRKDELKGNWSLTRNIDGKDVATYKFSDSFVLRPGQKIKGWAKGTRPFTGASGDIESDQNWESSHIITKLVNPLGEDRATHIQQTKYA